jgi:hypothetical protein
MKNPIALLLVLAMLLLTIVAPFAALSTLMLLLFGSVLLWFVWTLLQVILTGNHS